MAITVAGVYIYIYIGYLIKKINNRLIIEDSFKRRAKKHAF
jgi:hypothetical protein